MRCSVSLVAPLGQTRKNNQQLGWKKAIGMFMINSRRFANHNTSSLNAPMSPMSCYTVHAV
jgi:hypothetical protein